MSARLLRKVLKEQGTVLQRHPEEAEERRLSDEGESGSSDAAAHPTKNPFDLLDDDDNDNTQQENEPEVVDVSLEGKVGVKESLTAKATGNAVPSNRKSKKKKKMKRKDGSVSNKSNSENLQELNLEDLSFELDSSGYRPGAPATVRANSAIACNSGGMVKQCTSYILQVDPKFLRAENELRRIFGSKVVNSFEKSHQVGTSRQIHGGRRGNRSHRKTILVSPSEHWPYWDGSLSMELLETQDDYHCFRYMPSPSYSQAQSAFEAAKAIHDLNGIASILRYHPYHIDSLVTLAEYYKFSGEHQMSADLTAKCLYALECAWHPMFTPLLGNCQLKCSHETNKPLFVALFTHMKNMDRRGCHRSALEICKLLLSLDSDDPMGAIFCIDYFSLRAEEYAWLEQFSDEYKSDNSLWLFPNFSYSLAVCRFYLEHAECSQNSGIRHSKATSTDLMKQALMLHPSVVKKLVAKVPLKDRVWTDILANSSFASNKTGSPSLDHLINIYVERSYILWRLPDLQKFLRDSALQVIENLKGATTDAKDWACVRKESFSSEKNEYSHLMVSDFSDSTPTLPPDNLQNFMMRVDHNENQIANPVDGMHAPRDIGNRSALAVLFESMLPWINYVRDGEDGEHDDHGHENED